MSRINTFTPAFDAAFGDCLLHFAIGDVQRLASTIEKNFVIEKFQIGVARLQSFAPVAHEIRRHFAVHVKHLDRIVRLPIAKFAAC